MGQELYRMIKEQIRIEDYAAKRFGFTIVRRGKYYSLKEHDSVIIDPRKNCFWRNSIPGKGSSIGYGGSVIDFVMEFSGATLHEALKELTEEVYGCGEELPRFDRKIPKSQKQNRVCCGNLILPESAGNMRRVFAYLMKSRKIAKEVVQLLVDRKMLYQDTHGNCVFVSYDRENPGKAVFASLRGTNTEKPFYGDTEGSDYRYCWYLQNHSGRLYITESVIDALSKMTLLGNHMDGFDYLALSGSGKYDCVRNYLADPDVKEVWIGTDNDSAGKIAAEMIEGITYQMRPEIQVFRDVPEGVKDWNEFLKEKLKFSDR